MVKPILLYVSDVWEFSLLKHGELLFDNINKDDIEKCHLNYCKYLLGVNKRTPFYSIYGESGRFPLQIEALLNTIKFWMRLSNLETSSLSNKAFKEMSTQKLKNSWYMNMDSLMNIFPDVF